MPIQKQIAELRIDPESPICLHHQFGLGIERLILAGVLEPGDRLPKVTELCRLCSLSPTTVLRGLETLKQKRYLTSKRGVGFTVCGIPTPTTEVLIDSAATPAGSFLAGFYGQISEGLIRGYGDSPRRRVTLTFTGGHPVSAREIVQAALARGVDGLVVYRPSDPLANVLRTVAEHIPCVSLLRALPDSRAGYVRPDLDKIFERWLEREIRDGRKKFAYAGYTLPFFSDPDSDNPYARMLVTLRHTVKRYRLPLHEAIIPVPRAERRLFQPANRELETMVARLPSDCLLVGQQPPLTSRLLNANPSLTAVSYTECKASVQEHEAEMTLVYAGLDRLSEAAVDWLVRLKDGSDPEGPSQGTCVPVEMIEQDMQGLRNDPRPVVQET